MLVDNGLKVKHEYNYHMTHNEVKTLFKYVLDHCSMKYEIYLWLGITRVMRPAEILAINVLDFKNYRDLDFTKLTFREAKTNKIRIDEHIIPIVAERIKTYILLNNLKGGYLFPWYNKKVNGRPYMNSKTMGAWFSKIRKAIGKDHPEFLDQYPTNANDPTKGRYRIGLYALRRYGETYLYNQNGFSLSIVKDIMEYSKAFNPLGTYIRTLSKEEEKTIILNKTFNNFCSEINNNSSGQLKISSYYTA